MSGARLPVVPASAVTETAGQFVAPSVLARKYGLLVRWLYERLRSGDGPDALHVGRNWLIRRDGFAEWLAQAGVNPTAVTLDRNSRYISVRAAAKEAGVSVWTIYRWIAKEGCPAATRRATGRGWCWLIPQAQFNQWLDGKRSGGAAVVAPHKPLPPDPEAEAGAPFHDDDIDRIARRLAQFLTQQTVPSPDA